MTSPSNDTPESRRRKGIACIIASAFGFALMAMFVRLCDDFGGPVSSFQKSFFRNAIAGICAVCFLPRASFHRAPATNQGAQTLRHPNTLHLLLLRSLAGTVGIFCNFYAISNIPIGEAMTLNKTAPFFTIFLSWLFLHERATFRQILCLCTAFLGALLVIKPGFRFEGSFAAFCGLLGGFGAGVAYTCVHELGRRGVNGALIVLFFSAFSTLASIPFMVDGFCPMTWRQVLILVGAGCGAAIGQFGITAAYRFAKPSEIAVFDYTNIIFASAFGYMLFSQVPDIWSTIGFIAIVASAMGTRKQCHAQ